MARGKFISEFELTVMKIGLSAGVEQVKIAKFLGRAEGAITAHKKRMEEEGTLHDLPLAFVCDEIAEAMRNVR